MKFRKKRVGVDRDASKSSSLKTASEPSRFVVESLPPALSPESFRSTRAFSLGSGSFPLQGKISFTQNHDGRRTSLSFGTAASTDTLPSIKGSSPTLRRQSCSFIRVSDLEIPDDAFSGDFTASSDGEAHPHFHHASSEAPPGVEFDPREKWIALDDGRGSHAPVAPFAVEALAKFALRTTMDEKMWTPDHKTKRLVKSGKVDVLHDSTWQMKGKVPLEACDAEHEVLVWTGNFLHGLHGSDFPLIRSSGMINKSPKAMFDLVLDSSRIKEMSKISLGRTDTLVLQDNLDTDGPFGKSITKLVCARSKPPLMRSEMEMNSVMHARELEDGSGYLIVTRGVTKPGPLNGMRSEVLMNVNIIREVEGDDQRCLMINIHHLSLPPVVPTMLASKLGLSAAVGFFRDMREHS